MQKLVTIPVSNSGNQVSEHLNDYLEEGWIVLSMTPVGGNCLAVLLDDGEDYEEDEDDEEGEF